MLLFGNQNKKDRKVLSSFLFHIYAIAEMFDFSANIYLIAKKFVP